MLHGQILNTLSVYDLYRMFFRKYLRGGLQSTIRYDHTDLTLTKCAAKLLHHILRRSSLVPFNLNFSNVLQQCIFFRCYKIDPMIAGPWPNLNSIAMFPKKVCDKHRELVAIELRIDILINALLVRNHGSAHIDLRARQKFFSKFFHLPKSRMRTQSALCPWREIVPLPMSQPFDISLLLIRHSGRLVSIIPSNTSNPNDILFGHGINHIILFFRLPHET